MKTSSWRLLEKHKPWEKNKIAQQPPALMNFQICPVLLVSSDSVLGREKQTSPSCPPLQLSQPPHLPGISARLSSYTPGRICSSESCFSTIAGRGGNNESFQISHGNSSFSLQAPLAAPALHKAAAHRGDLQPGSNCCYFIKNSQAQTTGHSWAGTLNSGT